MKVHKDVVYKKLILYEQRKLNKDHTWKAAHGRQFRVESEYQPLHLKDYTKSPQFVNPLAATDRVESGMYTRCQPDDILFQKKKRTPHPMKETIAF